MVVGHDTVKPAPAPAPGEATVLVSGDDVADLRAQLRAEERPAFGRPPTVSSPKLRPLPAVAPSAPPAAEPAPPPAKPVVTAAPAPPAPSPAPARPAPPPPAPVATPLSAKSPFSLFAASAAPVPTPEEAPAQVARTAVAQRGFLLGEKFAQRLGARRFGGDVPRQARILGTEVLSTSGGKQAREPIALVPVDNGPGANVVCGFVDLAAFRAEVRSHATLERMHLTRTGMTLTLPKAEYEQFLDELRAFLAEEGLDLHLASDEAHAETPRPTTPVPAGRSSPMKYVAAGIAVAAVLLSVVLLLAR
ncbi:MAG: hypothetical protein AB2A00_21385 [Myxococcota bacterium]